MRNEEKVQNCASALRALLPPSFSPALGLVLGTGLDGLSSALERRLRIPCSSLPEFPEPSVPSHQGSFSAGILNGVPVLIQEGRWHLYEGHSPWQICLGVRVMALNGIRSLILTNSAGALNPLFEVGGLMVIEDQINLTGQSPLTGFAGDPHGPGFPDMSRAYDPALIRILEDTALRLGLRLEKGVYLCTNGPQLETRAETRALRFLGADAVGMSTVLETIAARQMGLKVLGLSCLTNKNLPDCMAEVSFEQIVATAGKAGERMLPLLTAALPALAAEG
ncbi:MAG: purine-nucleoside phosphorylase [Deltaproteobacteria bacterium]|nr:purine-nucleoside phosphorylase [Deltaproteobacteria bacterium]